MSVLFYGVMTFSLAFLIHFIVWKVHLPKKNQTVALLKIFFGVFIASIFIFKKAPNVIFFRITALQTFSDYLQLFLLYGSLTLAYIASYSAVEVDSPSLTMILNIVKAAPEGFDKERLYGMMTDDILVEPRIRDLANDRMTYKDKGKYKLTSKGIFLVNIFIFFRKLLNAPKGG